MLCDAAVRTYTECLPHHACFVTTAANRVYSEPWTADAWRAAYKYMVKEEYISKKEYMFAICLYSDKTAKRSQTGGSVWPILMTVLNQPLVQRTAVTGKGILGYIPIIKKPVAVSDAAFSAGINRLHHICYSQVLNRMVQTQREKVDIKLADGAIITGAMRLLMLCGDHPELQTLCGMSTGWNAKMPCRLCTCTHEDDDKFYTLQQQQAHGFEAWFPRQLSIVRQQREEALAHDTETAKQKALATYGLSRARAVSHVYPWHTAAGPLASAPTDKMHHVKAGIAKNLFKYITEAHEVIPGLTEAALLGPLTERLLSIPPYAEDRKYFRTFSSEVLKVKTLSCADVMALVFQMPYALGEVADVFQQGLHSEILKLLLDFRSMYLFISGLAQFTDKDLDTAETLIHSFLKRLRAVFGPDTVFNKNMNKPKIHAWSHLRFYMQQFGAWTNFDTDHFELSHKMTKDLYAKTNNHGGREEALTAMRRGMLRQEVAQYLLHEKEQQRQRRADEASTTQPLRHTDYVQQRPQKRWMVPERRKAKRLGAPGAPCTLTQRQHQILVALLKQYLDIEAVDETAIRVHTGYVIGYILLGDDGKRQQRWTMQARDSWHKQGPRHDDLLVKTEEEDGEEKLVHARALAFITYATEESGTNELAYIQWFHAVERSRRERPVWITDEYVAFRHGRKQEWFDVVDVDSIEMRAHLIPDMQHKPQGRDSERYYVRPYNKHCL